MRSPTVSDRHAFQHETHKGVVLSVSEHFHALVHERIDIVGVFAVFSVDREPLC